MCVCVKFSPEDLNTGLYPHTSYSTNTYTYTMTIKGAQ